MDLMSEKRAQQLLDRCFGVRDGFFLLLDPVSGHCQWCEQCAKHFDLSREGEDGAQPLTFLLHPADRAAFDAAFDALRSGRRQKLEEEYRLRLWDGSYQSHLCIFWRTPPGPAGGGERLAGLLLPPNIPWYLDPVTRLPSHFEFRRYVNGRIARQDPFTLILMEIDNFKVFNDYYSYTTGDHVLRCCGQLLLELLPPHCALCRSDGDGFCLVFPPTRFDQVQTWFQTAQTRLQQPHEIDGLSLYFTVSACLCQYPADGADADALSRALSVAMESLKATGRGRLDCYAKGNSEGQADRSTLLACLRASIAADFQGFSLRYQPLVNTQTGALTGCEALLRWTHPDFPGLPIQDCVALLESSSLIKEVGRFVLESAIRQCARWVQVMPDFCMNINVACQQFEDPGFRFFVIELLNKYHLPPEHIILELTESGKARNTDHLESVFNFLRRQRVRISFDDFGTGYASLSIFRTLSADELKIDRSFLERITYNVTDQAIVTTLIDLCHRMNMLVCVEGVETPELEGVVRQMGADILQGYYYAKPLTAEDFERQWLLVETAHVPPPADQVHPELKNAMAYAPLRPAQPLRLSDIIDHSYAGIFQVGMDAGFTFLTCNEGYRRMLGYTAAEIEKKFKNRALDFVHPDDRAYVNDEIRRQLGVGDTVTIEFRIVRKDGAALWIVGTGNLYRSPDGASSLIVVIVDNDEAKRRQLDQVKDAQLYQRLLSSLPVGVKMVRYDPSFTIDYISPGFLDLLGYTQEEVRTEFGGKFIALIYPEDREAVFADVIEQLKRSDVVTMRYRMLCKDGHLIWVETLSRLCAPDADGVQRACSSMVDLTDPTVPERSHGLNIANRYERAASQWGEFLFEFNLETNDLRFSDNFSAAFHLPTRPTLTDLFRLVYPEDRPKLAKATAQGRAGLPPTGFDLRLTFPDGSVRWFSAAFSTPEKLGDTPISVLGRLFDVDKDKREREKLVEQTQLDPLTRLLNKSATETHIRDLLEAHPHGRYALFMMDLDHFKQVNDTMGHFFGDKVLTCLAKLLRALSLPGDVVGRVGGDEFMVFTPWDGQVDALRVRADALLSAVRAMEVPDERERRPISISIGVSCYPEHGSSFYDLFRVADSSLYQAKELGRDRYSPTLGEQE